MKLSGVVHCGLERNCGSAKFCYCIQTIVQLVLLGHVHDSALELKFQEWNHSIHIHIPMLMHPFNSFNFCTITHLQITFQLNSSPFEFNSTNSRSL